MDSTPKPAAVERSVSFILIPDTLADANIHPLFQETQRPVTSLSRGFLPTSGLHFRASRSVHRSRTLDLRVEQEPIVQDKR
ncbi:hypothetical protein RRG08_042845 [Elysia crispata]|uniref:Uncharacterized protein n=1 Tax=Elysia crispata TaxID=231223 RepID=A0AAE1AJ16_9GAST|nr:hypothetical protein RRG08_042845 [Elysia crispata]